MTRTQRSPERLGLAIPEVGPTDAWASPLFDERAPRVELTLTQAIPEQVAGVEPLQIGEHEAGELYGVAFVLERSVGVLFDRLSACGWGVAQPRNTWSRWCSRNARAGLSSASSGSRIFCPRMA